MFLVGTDDFFIYSIKTDLYTTGLLLLTGKHDQTWQ